MGRKEAEELLLKAKHSCFVVRSSSVPGCLALTKVSNFEYSKHPNKQANQKRGERSLTLFFQVPHFEKASPALSHFVRP
jgi:hypothetical protein